MSKKLPFVTSDIPRDLRSFLDRVRELVSGSGADRLLSANDLANSGLAAVDGSGNIKPPPSTFVGTPPAPTNVEATAAIRNIIVTWDNPAYVGHAHAEVWGSSTSSQSAAVLLGMSPGAIYVDEVGPSVTRYYWVRFVNTNDTPGPYNALVGTSATTGSDVTYTLGLLAGSITTTELATALNNRIDLIDDPATESGSVNARLKTETDARVLAVSTETNARALADGVLTTAISSEAVSRANADSATASQITGVAATTGTNAAAIVTEQTARANADSATASQITGVAATTGTNAAAITAEQTARTTADSANASQTQVLAAATGSNNAAISAEQSARTTGDAAITAQTSSLLSRTADNAALVFTEQTARTAADAATASQINGLSASTGNAFSAVQSEATARSTEDTALALSITTLSSQVNNPTTGLPATRAELTTNYLTATDTENAIAQSATFLRAYADVQSKVFRQADEPTKRGVDPETAADIPLLGGDVWYDTNDSNKLYLWSGAAWVYSPDAVITGSVTDVNSRVTTVENTKIGYCIIGGLASDDTNKAACEAAGGTWNVGIPIATAVKQVSVSDGTDSATLETRATAQKTLNDGLQAQYFVKLDVNGNVAGYGVYADEGGSEFIANVDRFAVTTPQTSIQVRAISTTYATGAIARVAGADSKTLVCKIGGTTGTGALTVGNIGTLIVDGSVTWQVASRVPFAVQAVPTEINGQPVPAGVYVDAAYILNATVQNTQIADLAVDNAKIADLAVGTGKITDLAVTSAKIGDAAITSAKIEDAAITSAKIGDAAITSAKIADAAITTAKINDAAITTAKIGDAAITSAKIGDAAITSAKIGDAEIGTLKIAGNAVTVPVGGVFTDDGSIDSGSSFTTFSKTIIPSYTPTSSANGGTGRLLINLGMYTMNIDSAVTSPSLGTIRYTIPATRTAYLYRVQNGVSTAVLTQNGLSNVILLICGWTNVIDTVDTNYPVSYVLSLYGQGEKVINEITYSVIELKR